LSQESWGRLEMKPKRVGETQKTHKTEGRVKGKQKKKSRIKHVDC
jgi:hypothetical protein